METRDERNRKYGNLLFYIGFSLLLTSLFLPYGYIYESYFKADEEFPYRKVIYFGFTSGLFWSTIVIALIVLIASETGTPAWSIATTVVVTIIWFPGILFYKVFYAAGSGGPFGLNMQYGFYAMIAGMVSILTAAYLKAQIKPEED